jgi:hypothetical protein
LLRDKGAQRGGWLFALLEDASRKSEVTEHDGEAQTIRAAAAPIDQCQILGA